MKGPRKARFEAVFSEGRRVSGELARLSALPGTGLVGIATSKKIGSRPKRNRVRRRFEEAVRLLPMPRDPRLDYVLIVAQRATDVSFERIQEEVRVLFGRALERWAGELESS